VGRIFGEAGRNAYRAAHESLRHARTVTIHDLRAEISDFLKGQFFNETLGSAALGLGFANDVLLGTSCATVLTVLTRWNNEPHVQRERDWFHVVINMPPPKACGKEDLVHCHVRSAFPMISLGIATAKHWGAQYIFRVRTDMLVEKFSLPRIFDDQCVYSHTNPIGNNQISDNVMFASTRTMEAVFHPVESGVRETAESLVQKRVNGLGKKLCTPSQLSVWLVKPHRRLREQRSVGTRHWFLKRGYIEHETCKNLSIHVQKRSVVCIH
jgi:hypothetical protein